METGLFCLPMVRVCDNRIGKVLTMIDLAETMPALPQGHRSGSTCASWQSVTCIYRTIDLGIARHYFAPEEVRILNSATPREQDRMFFRFWSLKEAFIKATGEGLRRPLDSFSFSFEPVRIAFHPDRNNRPGRGDPAEWQFWEWHPANDCVAALAVRSTHLSSIGLDAGPARAADIGPL
jgi:hypothetical protein